MTTGSRTSPTFSVTITPADVPMLIFTPSTIALIEDRRLDHQRADDGADRGNVEGVSVRCQ